MLVVELDALLFRSKTVGRAGDENAVVEAPPSKDVKSSKSRSCVGSKPRVLRSRDRICSLPWMFILACGMLPVLCVNRGTGGR